MTTGVTLSKNQMGAFCCRSKTLGPLEPPLPSPGALFPATHICPSNCDLQMNRPIHVATSSFGNL